MAYYLFQCLRLRCNYFLCLPITALCYYSGVLRTLVFDGVRPSPASGTWTVAWTGAWTANKRGISRSLSLYISYFNVSDYAAIIFYAFRLLRCAVMMGFFGTLVFDGVRPP